MNPPTQHDISAMKNLMSILNGGTPEKQPVQQNTNTGRTSQPTGPISISKLREPDVGAMKKILENLNNATSGAVASLQETATYDRNVKEALQTEKTETGTRIGSWKINMNVYEKMGKEIKTYDIVNVYSNESLAQDLYLYEVAHGLVKLFNRGETLTSQSVREMLNYEEQYSRNRLDALRFKKRYQESIKKKDYTTADIMESRYQQARSHALSAKNQISGLYESI